MWIVFERAYRGLCRVETRAAAPENFVTSRECAFQPGAIFVLAFRRHIGSLDSAGAAVDRESNFLHFHGWLMIRVSFARNPRRRGLFWGRRQRARTNSHAGNERIC